MKLAMIEAAGFRGIRSSVSVPVTDGFLVVTGQNGSGKSTLFDAIEFALTGRISRPALASENREDINSYIWWRGSGEIPARLVRLIFRVGDGQALEVTRRPEGPSFRLIGRDGEAANLVDPALRELFADGSAPQDRIFERLCGTTIIRDEQITELSVDAPEASRFSLVNDTLGSTRLPAIEGHLNRTKQLLDARIRRLEGNYESLRSEVNQLVARTSEARSELQGEEPDSERARRDLAAAFELPQGTDTDALMRQGRSRIGQLRQFISILSRCLPRLQDVERRRTEIETDTYRAREAELDSAYRQASESETLARARGASAERDTAEFEERQPLMRSLGELVEHGKRVGLRDGRCPLCGSDVSGDAFNAHMREVADRIERESEGLSSALERREAALATERAAVAQRRQTEALLREHRRRAEDLRIEFDELVREIQASEGLAPPAEITAGTVEAALAEIRSHVVPLEASLARIEASAAYERLIEQERALTQARERFAAVERSLEAARRASTHQDLASRVVRRVAGELVDERLAQLEPLLVELYERLRPHVQWSTVGYKVRGDVKRFLRLTVGEDELNPRFMFSSGQRRALGLAFLLSVHLSMTWSRWNTLVLDDPMQHVDDYRALHLAEVLSSIRRSGRQVLCAVEDSSLADLLARRLATSESEEGSLVQLKYELGLGSMVTGVETLPPLASRLLTAA